MCVRRRHSTLNVRIVRAQESESLALSDGGEEDGGMVHPNAPRATAADVRAWLRSEQQPLTALSMAEFRRITGRGIAADALRTLTLGADFMLSRVEWALLTTNVTTAEDRRDVIEHLKRSALNNDSPATLNILMPRGLRDLAKCSLHPTPEFIASWRTLIEEIEGKARVALDLAGTTPPSSRNVSKWPLESALATRDLSVIAAWGQAAAEAAKWSRLDLLTEIGADDLVDELGSELVDDGVPRTADLASL